MKAVRFTSRSVPFAFALITVAAYGLLLPLTGFYWDDWPFAWIAHFLGPSEFLPAFQGFRPFLGPIFFATTSLLPADPLVWQGLALLIRFLAGLAAWYTIDQVWPGSPRLSLGVALLFTVFPGYSQHWVALTHINQEWISLLALLLSFGLSIKAVREPQRRRAFSAAALLLQAVALFPTEYFIGLELLRPFFLWTVLSESRNDGVSPLRSTWKAWLPYLLVWMINLAWLAYYYRSGAYISYGLTSTTSMPAVATLAEGFGDALWKAGFYVWIQILPLLTRSFISPTSAGTVAIIAISAPLLALYLVRLEGMSGSPQPSAGEPEVRRQGVEANPGRIALLAGFAGILLGRVPSLAAGLPLTLQSSFDRFAISMMLGASLFMAGLLELLVSSPRARAHILAALVALGIGQQFFNANIFRRDWQRQQEIYWQLAWRIPALEPHTAILTQQMPLDYETDLAMTAAVNWIYAEDPRPPDLPYAVIYTEKRLGGDALPELQPGVPMRLPFRTMEFTGNTSQVVAVLVPTNGCLRVFDPAFEDTETYSRFPEAITAAIRLSDPTRIRGNGKPRALPVPPFMAEPEHGWCYFYEKAELARQGGDWKGIVALRSQAARQGQSADDPIEWLPFIEAEARVGDASWAWQATRDALSTDPRLQRGLCALWARIKLEGLLALNADVLTEMHCTK